MANRQVLTVEESLDRDALAVDIADMFTEWENRRDGWLSAKKEVQDYVLRPTHVIPQMTKTVGTTAPKSPSAATPALLR